MWREVKGMSASVRDWVGSETYGSGSGRNEDEPETEGETRVREGRQAKV